MKRRALTLALSLAAAVCIGVVAYAVFGGYKYSRNCVSGLDGVEMRTERPVYPPDVDTVNCQWVNRTGKTLTFGLPFIIEMKSGDGWVKIGDEINFNLPSVELRPFSRHKVSYNIRAYSDRLDRGTYRIAIVFLYVREPGDYATYPLSVEFNVE